MKADLRIFPAYNEIYDLKFTDDDIKHLSTFPGHLGWDNISEEEGWAMTLISAVIKSDKMAAERKSRRLNSYDSHIPGITFNVVKKDDIKPEIIALPKKYNGYSVAWTGYGYYSNENIIIDTISQDDLKNIAIVYKFCKNILSDHGRNFLHSSMTRTRFKRYDLFLNVFRKLFLDIPQISFNRAKNNGNIENELDIIDFFTLLYPKAKVYSAIKSQPQSQSQSLRPYMNIITNVIEHNNRRYSISAYKDGYGYGSEYNRKRLSVTDSTQDEYDYVDVDRMFVSMNKNSTSALGDMAFIDSDYQLPTDEVIQSHLGHNRGADAPTILMTNKELAMIVKRFQQRLDRSKAEDVSKRKLADKIRNKINVLKTPKGKLKINGVEFTRTKILYENQSLILSSHEDEEWVFSVISRVLRGYNLDSLNFDAILAEFLNKIDFEARGNNKPIVGQIGDVTFTVSTETTTNTIGNTSRRTYINERRINQDEVKDCIERGLCFQKQTDFDYFLQEVSKCSLKIHKYLQRGISMTVRDEFNACEISMKLPITRKKNINYLVMQGREFRIKDTHKIIELRKARNLVEVLNVFMNEKILNGIHHTYIKGLVDAAKKEYITAIDKSKKLLKETVEMFKLEEKDYNLNGKNVHGFLIKGKRHQYVLEVHDDPETKNNVYTYPDGGYLCIVDKSTSQVGMDKLVNRIYALHNDSALASQIYTI